MLLTETVCKQVDEERFIFQVKFITEIILFQIRHRSFFIGYKCSCHETAWNFLRKQRYNAGY